MRIHNTGNYEKESPQVTDDRKSEKILHIGRSNEWGQNDLHSPQNNFP